MTSQDERYGVEQAQEASPPSTVQWEEPNLQLGGERQAEDTSQNRAVFFAKVIRTATEDDVKVLFSQFGTVLEVSLFRAFQGAPTTKDGASQGCGILTMSNSEEAAAAIAALDNKYVWPGMDCPMAVKWMDTQLQQRRRDQHLAAMRQRSVGPMGPDSWMQPTMLPPSAMMNPMMRSQAKMKLSEAPPAGCDPDALKLFVGNIPRSYTEEQLQPIFESMGKVVELVVVRDRATHESKGSAFVWYQTREEGERAILHFNMRHVLPDPAGEQDRPLAVRVAYRRHKLQPMGMMDPMAVMGEMPVHLQMPMSHMMQGGMPMGPPGMHGRMPGMGMPGMGMHEGSVRDPMDHAYRMQQGGGYGMPGGMSTGGRAPGMGGMYQGHGMGGDHMLPSSAAPSSHNPSMVGGGGRPNLSPTSESMGQVTHNLQLSSQHIQVVSNHLYSIQAMSNAQVRVAPGGPDAFLLMISGSDSQVESAEALISTVLNQTPGSGYA